MKPSRIPYDIRLMQAISTTLFFMVALFAIGLAAWYAKLHEVFVLQGIHIEGKPQRLGLEDIRLSVLPKLNGNFFTFDLKKAQTELESMPWVRKAVIQKRFPNQLRIVLQEQQAQALWGQPEDEKLLNQYGEIFSANWADVDAEKMPRLNGPAAMSSVVWQTYRKISPHIEGLHLQVQALRITQHGSWRADLSNGAVIQLGRGEPTEMAQRVARFVQSAPMVSKTYVQNLHQYLEVADLRYANGYALRLRGVGVQTQSQAERKEQTSGLKKAKAIVGKIPSASVAL